MLSKDYNKNLSKNGLYSHKLIRWASKIGHNQRDKCIAEEERGNDEWHYCERYNYSKSNRSEWEKETWLIVEQGKSNLTLSFGYMKLLIAWLTLKGNLIA